MERRVSDVPFPEMKKNGESNSGGVVAGEEQVIRWERFLPRRILRVLLVESDDSTRHIVAALLRKCSYQVAAVADGLKAWKILKERHYSFDLVLTEVVMPSLSGIGLLSKIMSNEICKNIPVIMMSSNDSIGIVFKCMLKGAADFLVKPVRKNELRNLWQHVWRKYCSSNCGDGSENGNSNDTKPEVAPNNEAASNYGSSNVGSRTKIGDTSEGSDTQSSCSRPENNFESPQKQEEPFQSECRSFAEVSNSKFEKHEITMSKVATSSILEKGKEKDKSTDIEIKLTLSIHKAVLTENVQEENGSYVRSPYWQDLDLVRSKKSGDIDPNLLGQNDGIHAPSKEVMEFIRKETTQTCSYRGLEDNGGYILHESANFSDAQRAACNSGSLPLWELSVRSQHKSQDKDAIQEKHILKHSEGSAFSKYVNAGTRLLCAKSPMSNSCINIYESGSSKCRIYLSDDNGSNTPFPPVEKPISSHVYQEEAFVQCQPSLGRNKVNADPSLSIPSREDASVSTSPDGEPISHHLQLGGVPVAIPVGAMPLQSLCSSYGTILHPFFYQEPSLSFHGSAGVSKELVAVPSKPSMENCDQLANKLQHVNGHLYYGNLHPHQLMQGMDEQRVNGEPTYARVMMHTPTEKTSGSNGTCEDMGVVANVGVPIESGLDRDHSRREAALTKFRLKRKDRCFEKKVRYHNRKKLAEQRPRVKGQFVRQTGTELNSAVAESDD